jgi:prepilin-type N-terminal cleavage/methylation domain-containing protein
MRQPVRRSSQKGFTLIELIIVGAILFILVGWLLVWRTILAGNYWFSEGGVLRELRADHPAVTEVIKSQRNIYADSVITVKEGEVRRDYCVDTNMLFNYEFSDCK